MKKIFSFLRSMRFGIMLLLLIALCSVAGSVIQQGQSVSYYAQTYQQYHGYILLLGLNKVFEGWFFITLTALLCLNLSLCTFTRLHALLKEKRDDSKIAKTQNAAQLSPEGVARLKAHLKSRHCKETTVENVSIYRKNTFGRWGTFVTHLSILLTVLFFAGALYLPKVTDQSCIPGESIQMEDGTEIFVDAFAIEGADQKLDYRSDIRVKLPDGRESEKTTIRVNHPLSFGAYKVYQQTYGTVGSLTITNNETGGKDELILDDECFLSMDGANGMWFEALYPGYVRDEDGNFTLITSTAGRYTDPVYQVLLTMDGENTPVLAFPGEDLELGEITFHFNAPIEYPGLRIKYTPHLVNAGLIAALTLMLIGLTITFLFQPVLVKVDENGYAVLGPKPEGTRIELSDLTETYVLKVKEEP